MKRNKWSGGAKFDNLLNFVQNKTSIKLALFLYHATFITENSIINTSMIFISLIISHLL